MHVMHLLYSHIDGCNVYNNGNLIFKTFEVTMRYDSEEMTNELILLVNQTYTDCKSFI